MSITAAPGASFEAVAANFATVARIWAHYLRLLVWPATLSADYSYDAFPVSSDALDPRAWAAALERMLGDPLFAARGGSAGRDYVRREHCLDRVVERTEGVYREAIERRRTKGGVGAGTDYRSHSHAQ